MLKWDSFYFLLADALKADNNKIGTQGSHILNIQTEVLCVLCKLWRIDWDIRKQVLPACEATTPPAYKSESSRVVRKISWRAFWQAESCPSSQGTRRGTSLHPKPSERAYQRPAQKAWHVPPGVWGLGSLQSREAYTWEMVAGPQPACQWGQRGAALLWWQGKVCELHRGPCGCEEGVGLGCFQREPHRRTPE